MINPNSSLDINAIEAFPLEDFSLEVNLNLKDGRLSTLSNNSN